jgi:hypothetical protein
MGQIRPVSAGFVNIFSDSCRILSDFAELIAFSFLFAMLLIDLYPCQVDSNHTRLAQKGRTRPEGGLCTAFLKRYTLLQTGLFSTLFSNAAAQNIYKSVTNW